MERIILSYNITPKHSDISGVEQIVQQINHPIQVCNELD